MTTALPASVELSAPPPTPPATPVRPAAQTSVDDEASLFLDALNIVVQAQTEANPNTSASVAQFPEQHANEDAGDTEQTLPGMSMLLPPMMVVPLTDIPVMSGTTALSAATASVTQEAGASKDVKATVAAATIDIGNMNLLPQRMRLPLPSEISLTHDALPLTQTQQSMVVDTDSAASAPPPDVNLHAMQLRARDEAIATADHGQKMTAPPAPDLSPYNAPLSSMLQQTAGADTSQVSSSKPVAAPTTQTQQPLVEALGERIHMQLGQRIEQAVIRLDPQKMGTVEVVIRHEAGALQVHLSASHSEVLRQLHNIGDSLRLDLAHRQYTDVSVMVSNGMRDGDGRQRPRHATPMFEEPGLALFEADQAPTTFSLLN